MVRGGQDEEWKIPESTRQDRKPRKARFSKRGRPRRKRMAPHRFGGTKKKDENVIKMEIDAVEEPDVFEISKPVKFKPPPPLPPLPKLEEVLPPKVKF